MTSSSKRRSSGYGLRRNIAKKRLDDDFEYYFSKIGTNLESSESQHSVGTGVMMVMEDKQAKSTEKKPRGRPRKGVVVTSSREFEIYEPLSFVDLKEKRVKRPRLVDQEEESEGMVVGRVEEVVGVLDVSEEEVNCLPGQDEEDPVEDEAEEPERRGRKKHARNALRQLGSKDRVQCEECHKLLKPSSFRQHLRTHLGEKPFSCSVCDAKFTRKADVMRHVRIVHDKQKPYKCCRCQRAFGDKKNLRWHLTNHDKKLFYICEVCGFKFGKRDYWVNHVRYIHPLPGGLEPGEEQGADDCLASLLGDDDEGVVDEPEQLLDSLDNKYISLQGLDQSELLNLNLASLVKQEEGDDTVVIQLHQQNLVQVVSAEDMLDMGMMNEEHDPSKVIRIVLDEQAADPSSMQTLVEVLLDGSEVVLS